MTDRERPDLTGLDAGIVAYIEALEEEVTRLQAGRRVSRMAVEAEPEAEVHEPPTPYSVLTFSRAGMVKRTPRHFYGRQRRGGMGVFDLDVPEEDAPVLLSVLHEAHDALIFTSEGRAFRLPVGNFPEAPVRAKGQPLTEWLPLRPDERVVAALPDQGGAYVALAVERGWVHRVRASFLGPRMIPGMVFHDVKQGGPLVGACWTVGDGDLFVVTRRGLAIRFPEQRVHEASGSLGIRLERDDHVAAIAGVTDASMVFLLGDDGKGTLRQMSGFAANKMPGGGGKVALKAEVLAAAVTAKEGDDLFVISRLSKIIRFAAAEVPPKEGVVQGVNCMALRADETTAAAVAVLEE